MKQLFVIMILVCLSIDVSANFGDLGQTLLRAVESVIRKTDGKWADDMETLEKSLFGESLGPFSIEEIVKLREAGVEPLEWLKSYKSHLEYRKNNSQHYQDSPEPALLNYLWNTEVEAHIKSSTDSPLISRWLSVPEMQQKILDIVGSSPLNKNYFTGKPDLLLKYWELGESQKVELMIRESFDKARESSDFARAFFIEDPFIRTVNRAFRENRDFKDYVESLFETLFDE